MQATRYKAIEIAKPITPPSESAFEEDNDPEQAQKDKDHCKVFQETLQTYQQQPQNFLKHQKQKYRYYSKEFGHYAKEYRKPKRVKDSTYHKEKMLLCKQVKKGVQLQAEQSDWLADTDEEIDEQELEAHYSYMAKIQEVPYANSGTNAKPLEQDDQNDVECDDEHVALANLIANLKLDVDENKKIQKQLKKANATLTQELTECKSILAETSRTLGESNSIRDSCLVALQNKQTEFERYKAFNDRTVDYDKLERRLNETLGLLAQKEIDIKEGLKVKAYEISIVKEKHDELVKQSLLTKSHYEGLVKEKTKVITDLKLKEEKDIDKMISMENQLKFLNEIVYKRSQSIQTIHMLAPKCPTFNGRPTFANPRYLKKAQNEIPCLYAIPHDQSDPANRLVPDREETLTLDNESRSKLNKDLVKPFDYTKLNRNGDCLAQKLLNNTEFNVKKQMKTEHRFAKEKESNVFRKETVTNILEITRFEKAQLQDKNICNIIVQLHPFIVDPGFTKHMTGNLSFAVQLIEKILRSTLSDIGAFLVQEEVVIVCHEKVVRISLEGDEILRVQGECTQGVAKTLLNTKVVEFRKDLIPGATPVAKSPCRLAPSEMQEWSEQLQELQDKGLELLRKEKLYVKFSKYKFWLEEVKFMGHVVDHSVFTWTEKRRVKLRRVRAMSMTIQSSVKDKILATPSETSKYDVEIRYHPGKANVMTDALTQSKAFKQENVLAERLHGLDQQMEVKEDENAAESVRDAIGFEYYLASLSGWTKSPVLRAEIGEDSLIRPELVQEMTDKKCLADASLHVPLDEIKVDKTLRFVEKPIEIMDREIRKLKR
ncbi:hypothetical protein Tco_0895808 [Tanacetum coccineum]|uniref:Reverse transcriptase domain-containing protein n=1 Tax=Tanacetum coccineum TaxID=301880 RepID=A0ABQ5CFM5_9ASTR